MDTIRTVVSADDGEPLIIVFHESNSPCVHLILHTGIVDVTTSDDEAKLQYAAGAHNGALEYLIHLDDETLEEFALAVSDTVRDIRRARGETEVWL